MAPLMGSRSHAEQFAALLDGRTNVERAPADLRDLLDVVDTMRTLDVPRPTREFSAALREQLMAEAEQALTPASPLVLSPRRRGGRERRITAAAAVFTLVGGSAGMALASQSALPGEALYPIKRGIEDAQLGVRSAPEDRGRTYLDQATDRLQEADRLLADDAATTTVERTVDSFLVQAVAGADLLLGSFEQQQSGGDVEVLRQFTATALTRLQTLAADAPADIQDELARAAVVLQRIDQQAAAACADCSDLPTLEMPLLMAQAVEISRAMEAVRAQQPNNDHPSIGVKIPRTAPEGTPVGESDPRAAPPGAGTPGASQPLGGGTAGALPRDTREALEQLDQATGGLLGKVGTKTGESTQELTDGLADAIESALGDG